MMPQKIRRNRGFEAVPCYAEEAPMLYRPFLQQIMDTVDIACILLQYRSGRVKFDVDVFLYLRQFDTSEKVIPA